MNRRGGRGAGGAVPPLLPARPAPAGRLRRHPDRRRRRTSARTRREARALSNRAGDHCACVGSRPSLRGCGAFAVWTAGRRRADPVADFYKGKQINLDPERRMRAAAMPATPTPSRPISATHIPGKPQHRHPEHAGRRRHPRHDLSQFGRAQGRHHHRAGAFERAVRAALRHRGREIRSAPDELDRQPRTRHRHLRRLAHVRRSRPGRICSTRSSSSAAPAPARRWKRCR